MDRSTNELPHQILCNLPFVVQTVLHADYSLWQPYNLSMILCKIFQKSDFEKYPGKLKRSISQASKITQQNSQRSMSIIAISSSWGVALTSEIVSLCFQACWLQVHKSQASWEEALLDFTWLHSFISDRYISLSKKTIIDVWHDLGTASNAYHLSCFFFV